MGSMTMTVMAAELNRRVTQLAIGGGGPCETALNRAIRWINRQGSYTFQLQSVTALSVVGGGSTVSTPADFDSGKACLLMFNGIPIKNTPVSDLWESQNINTITDSGFSDYYITAAGSGASVITVLPINSITQLLTFIYHKVTADITGGATSNLPRDFDDLVIDLAEAEEKRIYDVGDAWPQLLARAQDQIKVLLDGYKTQTIETGLDSEASEEIAMKAKLGRD